MTHKIKLSWLIILLLILLPACNGTTGPTSEPPPTSPTTTSVSWAPDGVITAGEYARTNTLSGAFELYHSVSDGYINVGIKAGTSGWVAVAFISSSSLTNVDFVIGYVENGQVTVTDQFTPSHPASHGDDTTQGGVYSIVETGGSENAGVTIIEFRRLLNTGDTRDTVIIPGNQFILWAYGSTDDLTVRHQERGQSQIQVG